MAKREEFTLTIEQCQRLTETAVMIRNAFPKKWGEKAIPDNEQLIGREDVNDLYKALRGYSSWMQGIGTDYKLVFGNKEDYYPADADGKKLENVLHDDPRIESWKFKDPKRLYKLRLSREALSGVVWCAIIRLHPQTSMPLSTRDNIETWWGIAEAVGKSSAIRKYIGLAAAARTEWEDDPEPETPLLPPPETKAP